MIKDKVCEARIATDMWHPHTCKRPAKHILIDGTPVCGIHFRQEQKRLEDHNKRNEEFARWEILRQNVAALGLSTAQAHNDKRNPSTPSVLISFEELKNLVNK